MNHLLNERDKINVTIYKLEHGTIKNRWKFGGARTFTMEEERAIIQV